MKRFEGTAEGCDNLPWRGEFGGKARASAPGDASVRPRKRRMKRKRRGKKWEEEAQAGPPEVRSGCGVESEEAGICIHTIVYCP